MKSSYDCIVLGGGAGGLTAAKTARGFGKSVAIIEKNKLGGECTWTGCVPSKALIYAANNFHQSQNLNLVGIKDFIAGVPSGVLNHVRTVVQNVYQTHTPEKIREDGIDVIFGTPSFVNNYAIVIDGKTITAKKFVVATGSSPFVPSIDGIDRVKYLTNETLFNLEKIPASLVILGGGAIGCEMACAFNRLGTKVTVLEMQDRVLPKEDEELVKLLSNQMRQEGVTLLTNVRATAVAPSSNGIVVTYQDKTGAFNEVTADEFLVAVGRTPNCGGLDLEKAGVQYDTKKIIVNNKLQTTASNIYACGDVVGPYQFSHMAWHQAVVAVRNAFIPVFKKKMDYDTVCWVTFTAPELATAGLTEQEARKKYGNTILVYRHDYDAVDRGRVDLIKTGRAKFICDKHGYLIGAHVLGPCAGELISGLQVTRTQRRWLPRHRGFKPFGDTRIPFDWLSSVIYPYPTYSEVVWHAAKEAYIDRINKNFFVKLAKKLFF